jgi:hypothetical protein
VVVRVIAENVSIVEREPVLHTKTLDLRWNKVLQRPMDLVAADELPVEALISIRAL